MQLLLNALTSTLWLFVINLLGLLKNKPGLIIYQMQIDDLTLCNSRSLDESSGTREIYHDLRVLTKVRWQPTTGNWPLSRVTGPCR